MQEVYDSFVNQGLALIDTGDLPGALESLKRALALRPHNGPLEFVMANAYRALGDEVLAEQFFKSALALDPLSFPYNQIYAMFLHEVNRREEACSYLEAARALNPNDPQLHNDLGVLYHELKNPEKATFYFEKANALKPDYLVPLVNLGHIYSAQGDSTLLHALINRFTDEQKKDLEVAELIALATTTKAAHNSDTVGSTNLSFSNQSYSIAPLAIVKEFGEKLCASTSRLSIVVPIYNEVENIPILYQELTGVLKNLREEYEIIFVNDGSKDGSREVLNSLACDDRRIAVIHFRRNYGQTAALGAGFKYSHGDVVITLDADLQNDPADIPRLLEKMAEGYDLVNGWRKKRQDKALTRRLPSMIANRIINKLIEGTGVQLNDFGCTLKAYKKGIVKNIHLYGEMHRFIPVFAAWLGVKVAEIPVNHRPRVHGVAKYNLSRVSRVIFDLVVVRFFSDYMTRPIQFFGKIAKNITTYGLLGIILLSALGLTHTLPISLNTILILIAILLLGGMQILFLGLLGEVMIRFYFEVQKKDYFVVESVINRTEQS